MAVFRQIRTAVMFATVPQKWDMTALTFSLPSKKPNKSKKQLKTERGVVAIRIDGSKTRYVAASRHALRDIAAMSAHEAKDQLIKGVLYVKGRQGAAALAKHVNNPQDTGSRYSLPCNTGPTGSGKTVLQRQNMLQVARDSGFLAVEIEFNSTQFLHEFEKKANFARLVANRILCYLPKYCVMQWSTCLKAIAKDFEWKDESPLDVVTKAVQVLKKALNHKGPVLLAVDELARAPGCRKDNLTDLCGVMDGTLHKRNNNRILLVVPVYDLVDRWNRGTVSPGSKRQLVQSTAVMFATVTQKRWDMTSLTFSLPSTELLHMTRDVVAIRNKDSRKSGLVAASSHALRDIAAMSAHEAKDRLIKGVPYVVRRQGAAALAAHINNPQGTGGRFSLPCNTGPTGSGKTVLQRQNMLQVARDFGFLAVEIEFNGIQPIIHRYEKNASFARRVANRILCYLPKYCTMQWSRYLQAIARDFEWEDESPLDVVTNAVELLKKALNHKGPVLLAVDELARAPGCGKDNLSDLCAIMDETPNDNDRILLAVSVYTLVDLGELVTESRRLLVHQELPPILPVLLDSSVENCLPDWLKVLFNTKLRASLGEEAFGSVAKLLTESGGHPRRVEALIAEGNAISKSVRDKAEKKAGDKKTTLPSDGEILMSQLQSLNSVTGENTCLAAMNQTLNLRTMGQLLSKPKGGVHKKAKMILLLLKYVFTTVDMNDADAKILRSATTMHYQLVPHGAGHVGYLPLPALQSFCLHTSKLPYSLSKESISYILHAEGVAKANLSTIDTTTTDTKLDEKARSNDFKMSMFHALCGAVLARKCLTEYMFRHSPKNLPETRCTEIEWAKDDVELFPSAVENGATLRVCDDKTLHRICEVGAFNEEGRKHRKGKQLKGLAFVPTDKWNTCCDFVLVLPTADWERAGRVVFAVQCKHWTKDVAGKKGLHALAHFRYGRHCFEADEVFLPPCSSRRTRRERPKGMPTRGGFPCLGPHCIFHSVENSFRDKFCDIVEQQNKDSDTRVVFVLATVNDTTQAGVKASVFNKVNLPDEVKYKSTALLGTKG